MRGLYDHDDAKLALSFVQRLGNDLQDSGLLEEALSLGRTLLRWQHQIAAWHEAHVSNGPTEATNNSITRVKRVAFGFRSFRNDRIRVLLYAGKPNWSLLAMITPRLFPMRHKGATIFAVTRHQCTLRFEDRTPRHETSARLRRKGNY